MARLARASACGSKVLYHFLFAVFPAKRRKRQTKGEKYPSAEGEKRAGCICPVRMTRPEWLSFDLIEHLRKVGDQVVGLLDADRVADQAFGNAHRRALVGIQLDMAGGGGWADHGFDCAEVGG